MKKYFILTFLIGLSLIAFSVLAKSDNKNNNGQQQNNEAKQLDKAIEKLENFTIPDVESTKINPSSLFIGPQGQVRIISGELTSIGTTTPAADGVKIWGINFSVDVSGAKFNPTGTTASSLKVGDKVNIKGTINKDTGIITASIVHSLATTQQNVNAIQAQITELLKRIRELQEKLGLPLTPLP